MMAFPTKVALHSLVPFFVANKTLLLESLLVVWFSPSFARIVLSIIACMWPIGRLWPLFVTFGLHYLNIGQVSALMMVEVRVFCLRQLDLLPRPWGYSLSTSPMSRSCNARSKNFLIYPTIGPVCLSFIMTSLVWNVHGCASSFLNALAYFIPPENGHVRRT